MNTKIDTMKAQFHRLVGYLRNFGFNGEILLKSGLLIVGAKDKHSAAMIRKAFKQARNASGGTITELRSKTGAAFVWVDDSLALSKPQIRELAEAA